MVRSISGKFPNPFKVTSPELSVTNDVRNILWNLLSNLTADEKPDWDQVSRSWVQALLDCDSNLVEKMVFKLGDPVRRRERASLIAEIDKILAHLSAEESSDLADTAVAA